MNSRQLIFNVCHHLGLTALARKVHPPGLGILMFHGFTDRAHEAVEDANDLHQPISEFAALCAHLARHYHVISLSQALFALRTGEALPAKSVVITFDDGLASNYHLAFPILQRYQLPATIFAVTDFVENGAWLWTDRVEYALGRTGLTSVEWAGETFPLTTDEARLHAIQAIGSTIKSLPQEQVLPVVEALEQALHCALSTAPNVPAIYQPLTWEQAREMEASGLVEIGGHTHRHLILSRCTAATAEEEMRVSQEILTMRLGHAPTLFAYPNGQPGDFSADSQQVLLRSGFQSAVTTVTGFNEPHAQPGTWELQRFGQPRSVAHLEMLLSGASALMKLHLPVPVRLLIRWTAAPAALLLAAWIGLQPWMQPPAPAPAAMSAKLMQFTLESTHTSGSFTPLIPPSDLPLPPPEQETAAFQSKAIPH